MYVSKHIHARPYRATVTPRSLWQWARISSQTPAPLSRYLCHSQNSCLGARIYLTEGTSQAVFEGNIFTHLCICFQQTTDDVIHHNQFNDAHVGIGGSYNPYSHPLSWGYAQDQALLSFGSQVTAYIGNNTFKIDSSYTPPWIIDLGHFDQGKIHDNVISYDGTQRLAAINSDGGEILRNTVTLGDQSSMAWGIAVIPDEGPGLPPSSFLVQNNVITATSTPAAIYVVNTGFLDSAPVCIESNAINIQKGQAQSIPPTVTLACQ